MMRTGFKLLFAVAATCFLAGCRQQEPASAPKADAAGTAWFQDVTESLGVNFVHDSGATSAYFMPESIGSGGALIDFDNDGRLDLYLIHCVPPGSPSRNRLYHQQTDGKFRDVSAGSGLDVSGYGMGVAVGDVNNDGLPDVLLTEYGVARLFVNHGGSRFKDVTIAAGIENTRWGMSATFFDYDRDGWLDLVIANYVDYTPTQKCFDTRGVQEYCGPQGMAGTVTRLFRNRGVPGKFSFEDVTVPSGLAARRSGTTRSASIRMCCWLTFICSSESLPRPRRWRSRRKRSARRIDACQRCARSSVGVESWEFPWRRAVRHCAPGFPQACIGACMPPSVLVEECGGQPPLRR